MDLSVAKQIFPTLAEGTGTASVDVKLALDGGLALALMVRRLDKPLSLELRTPHLEHDACASRPGDEPR
jgi:hypothetical protein